MSTLLSHFLDHPSVTIDSRDVKAGQIFFAIRGDHFDGNRFVPAALEAGAALCVSSDSRYEGREKVIVVPDTLIAIQQLARAYRDTFSIPVLAVTGSNGKTTTKELLARVLATQFNVHVTKGNLNNHLGVPLTLLAMPRETTFTVIEMGANHIGEIYDLCQIARPGFGLITNIGLAHLEGFGSPQGVRTAKSELFRFLEEQQGIRFLNMEEESLHFLADQGNKAGLVEISSDDADLYPSASADGYLAYRLGGEIHSTHLVGGYNFNNVLAAFSVGRYFGCDTEAMSAAIASYHPDNNRSQRARYRDIDLILDAYNANPSSVAQALNNLSALPAGRKAVILGDMLELGEDYLRYHRQILMQVRALGELDHVYLIGPHYSELKAEFPEFDFYGSTELAAAGIEWPQLSGYTVLIKGSRGLKLETLVH